MAIVWKPEILKWKGSLKIVCNPKNWNLCLFSVKKKLKGLSTVGMGEEGDWKETSALLLWKIFIYTHIDTHVHI